MLARWIRAGLAVALLGVGVARAEPIAIVTDLQGGASLQAGAITVPLAILSELEDGARVQLMSGARMTALYVRSGDEYTAQGPGIIEYRTARPEATGGASLSRRAPPQGREIRICH